MIRKWKQTVLVGALGLAAGGAVGCAQERPPINRVQADALSKSFFVGDDLRNAGDDPEFYMRNTVIDVGYGAAQDGLFTATYAQPVSRIRWQVTEDHLIARLAYERIQDSDSKGNKFDGFRKKMTEDGQIVASYRIKSHFDIRRAYNPATGEESNIIEENSSDRPWDQREYFRVDWSQNESTGAYEFDTLSMMGIYGGIKYSPMAYTVLESNDGKHAQNPDAPHFDAEMGYFDVTNKAYAEPVLIDLSSLGWGIDTFPACMLSGDFAGGTQPAGNCNPVEITLRQSFKRVVDTDYEPMDIDGYRFQALGNFFTEYHGYERNYGMVDDKWFRFGDRYNLWQRSHFYGDPEKMTGEIQCDVRDTTITPTDDPHADPNRDDDHNGTSDECEAAGAGSRCDLFKGKCTLPYAQRKAITIPWYINGGSSETLQNLAAQIEDEKNKGAAADQTKITSLNKQIAEAQQKGEELFEATDWAVQEWDLAMKTSIQTARLVECKRTGGADCAISFPMWTGQQDDIDEAVAISRDINACRRSKGWENTACNDDASNAAFALDAAVPDASKTGIAAVVSMPSVIVLCHNPVIKGDHPACGAEGLAPRLGDLRYHSVLNIDKPQTPSAWGIMVDAVDPITGEKVAASINVWTHITDVAVQNVVDLVRYMNGELSTAEITNGQYVRDWVAAQKASNGAAGAGPTMTRDEVTERMAAAARVDIKTYKDLTEGRAPMVQGKQGAIRQLIEMGRERTADVAVNTNVASPSQAGILARMKKVRGTEAEAKLINPAMLQAAGISGSIPIQGPIADMASPMALNNPKFRSQLQKMRENALAERGVCILAEAPEASALTGIADIMKKKFPIGTGETGLEQQTRIEKMVTYLRRRFHYAVIAHEMGHSIGLRHNFVSSYASLNFRPQYWQLRTKNGTVKTVCQNSVNDGSSCVGPRYFDPITDEEQSQMIWQFMHSTVMDYPGDVSQDLIGLGVTDFAAARLFYGDVVSVFSPDLGPKYQAGGAVGVGMTVATDDFGGLSGIQYSVKAAPPSTGIDTFHYSEVQNNYEVIKNCYAVAPSQPSTWREEVDGIWDQVMDGHIVSVNGAPTKCRQLPVDYAGWTQLRFPNQKWDMARNKWVADTNLPDTNKRAFWRSGPSVVENPFDSSQPKLIRVPYGFATDHWADTGNVSVFRHDNGADPYEQMMFLITTQENRHIFDNFRRNRSTFNVRAAADRSFSRYNEKMLGISGGIGFYATIYSDLATNQGFSFDTLWPLIIDFDFKSNIIAATVAMDHFSRELSRPEPGVHYYKDKLYGDPVLRSDTDADDYGAGTNFGIGASNTPELVRVPNGTTGYFRDVSFAGHPIENALSEDHGDFDTEYMETAGSYYEKINSAILLSESEDRFVSQSRRDFYDARFRAVGMADVLPEGFRRIMANALTGDRSMMAPRIEAAPDAQYIGPKPTLDTTADTSRDPDAKKYPGSAMGWVSWWPNSGPTPCFSSNGKNVCADYSGSNILSPLLTFPGGAPVDRDHMALVDPQLGWEVQKFLIAWTFSYIPANQKSLWTDMMHIYRLKNGVQPEFNERIEWQDPVSGQVYYARTYGMECLFGNSKAVDRNGCEIDPMTMKPNGGKWVQKGIGARVLEWANLLTGNGYLTDKTQVNPTYGPGFNAFGRAMILHFNDGTSVVKPDPAIKDWNSSGTALITVQPCEPDAAGNPVHPVTKLACKPLTYLKNHHAYQLVNYKAVPDYLHDFGELFFTDDHVLGQYP